MKRNNYRPTAFVLLCCFSLLTKTDAQDTHLKNFDASQLSAIGFSGNKDLNSLGGVKFFTGDLRSTDGSNFFNSTWDTGMVYFKNRQQYRGLLQFDFVKNELHFKEDGKTMKFANAVGAFTLFDTTNGGSQVALFSNGYPPIGASTSETFYQIIGSGATVHLLKSFLKQNVELLSYDSPDKKDYKVIEQWYVYDPNKLTMASINLTISSLSKALPAQTNLIQKFNKIKRRKSLSEQEAASLIDDINNDNAPASH